MCYDECTNADILNNVKVDFNNVKENGLRNGVSSRLAVGLNGGSGCRVGLAAGSGFGPRVLTSR